MNRTYFVWNGISSTEFDIDIMDGVEFQTAERDISFETVLGRHGELAVDNERYDCGSYTFPVRINKPRNDLLEHTSKVSRWLNSTHGFKELYFSGDPDYFYKACLIDRSIVGREKKIYAITDITFKLHPYKYLVDGQDEMTLLKGEGIVTNGFCDESKPIITVFGNGDVDLFINGTKYALKGIKNSITIDCEMQECYDKDGQASEKAMFEEFPYFKEGNNNISCSGAGTVSTVKVIPNWAVLI